MARTEEPTIVLRGIRTPADARALGRLVVELARYEKLEPPAPAALRRLGRDAMNGRRFVAILAWKGATPVGYSITFETYSTFQGRPVFYLEDLFVLPEERRHGIGTALFLDAVERAKRCCRMEWQVLSWNEPALRFYEKLGATKLTDWTWHRLDETGIARLSSRKKAPRARATGRPGSAST